MRRAMLTWVLMAGLCVGGGTGCDREAAAEASSRQSLLDALAALERAQRGFIPPDVAQADPKPTIQEYRQQALEDAESSLRETIADGGAGQRLIASRLLADVLASRARHHVREANAQFAELATRSATIISYLRAANEAEGRTTMFDLNQGELIEELEQEVQRYSARRETLATEAAALEAQIANLRAGQQGFQQQATAAMNEAQRLLDEAFVAESDRAHELRDQAAELQRRAAEHSADADRQQVRIDAVQSKLTVLQNQLNTTRGLLEDLRRQIDETRAQQREIGEAVETAQQQRSDAVQVLADEFEQFDQAFSQIVDQRYAAAAEAIADAVAQLEQPATTAPTQERLNVRLDLLGILTDQAYVNSEYAVALSNHHTLTTVIAAAARELGMSRAEGLAQRAEALRVKASSASETAEQAIAQGRELIEQILAQVAEDSDEARIARSQRDRLQTYFNRLETAGAQ